MSFIFGLNLKKREILFKMRYRICGIIINILFSTANFSSTIFIIFSRFKKFE